MKEKWILFLTFTVLAAFSVAAFAGELHEAVQRGDLAKVKQFLSNGAAINTTNGFGWTPLHAAAYEAKADTVALLLEKGADVKARTRGGETPLHLASANEASAVTKLLLEKGADVNARDDNGLTPLHRAAGDGATETVELLLSKGAELMARDGFKQTPLHMAAARPTKVMVELLLSKGADVNAKENAGQTPLHVAAADGVSAVAQVLLEKGADLKALNNSRQTPLDVARARGNKAVVELFAPEPKPVEVVETPSPKVEPVRPLAPAPEQNTPAPVIIARESTPAPRVEAPKPRTQREQDVAAILSSIPDEILSKESRVDVILTDDTWRSGVLTCTSIVLRTEFGSVPLAVSAISMIRIKDQGKSVVVETRGKDRVTGRLEAGSLSVKTERIVETLPFERLKEIRVLLPPLVEDVDGQGNHRLVLRPDSNTAVETYIDKLQNRPSENHVGNGTELFVSSWTVRGTPITSRILLNFKDLSRVPVNARVVSAKLFLYGVESSVAAPQGNSDYPRSPYGNRDNSCLVQRIDQKWEPSMATFDNQPASTKEDQAVLSASTSQWNYDATVDVTSLVKTLVTAPDKNFPAQWDPKLGIHVT